RKFYEEIDFNIIIFRDIDKNPELYKFIEENFSKIPKKTQEEYLKFVVEGTKEYKKYLNENHPDITSKHIEKQVKYWQKRKIKAIKNFLEPTFLKKLDIELQELEKVKLFEKMEVIFGDRSPISSSDINKMSISELSSFLNNYEEKEGIGFNKIGLGRQVREHIKERPEESIDLLKASLSHPKMHKYISFIIDGFSLTLKENIKVDILELLSIFNNLLNNKIKISNESIFLKENTLRDIKKSIADFIYDNLKPYIISITYKEKIWEQILSLLQENDLTKEIEITNIERNLMPKEMCLNTIRGVATELVVIYTSWIIESNSMEDELEEKLISKLAPEVLKVLDNLIEDLLYTTRYILGMNFNYLCSIELSWVKRNLSKMLPDEEEKQDYFEAIWAGFLDFNNVVFNGFKFLKPYYEYALKIINKGYVLIPFSRERLVNHLMVLYIYGVADLEKETSIVNIFFKNSDGPSRRSAIRSIGTNLDKYLNEEEFDEIKDRLIKLMELRIKEAKKGNLEDFKEEIFGFIFWFRNSIFDKEWMINQFLEVLRLLNGQIYVFSDVVDILNEYIKGFPDQVFECLELIIKSELKTGYLIYEEKFKSILKGLLKNENPEIRQKVVDLINYLIKINFHNFSDLLRK
ncbi:MAG: hypothetical protein ACFFG0_09160, partial [Candidatus Thorarchaeota archaeon]